MKTKYYYLAMAQKSMLQNQILEEILRERAHNYFIRKKSLDFWVVITPNFLTKKETQEKILVTNFFLQKKSELLTMDGTVFYSCIISLDIDFLRWIQLRLGSFENLLQFSPTSVKANSDGILGQCCLDKTNSDFSTAAKILNNNKNKLHFF